MIMSEWPVSTEIQEGFYTFSENTFKMNDVRKLDGRIQANAAQSNQSTQEYENCGSRSHGTKACSAALTTCFFCGKTGHMQKYRKKKGKDISNNKKSSDKYAHHSYPANNKRSSKSLQRTKLLQASANTVESINDVDYETFICQPSVVQALSTDFRNEELFVVDSACKGAHIFKDENIIQYNERPNGATVQGISGHSLTAQATGSLGTRGTVLMVKDATTNLLSLRELLKCGDKSLKEINRA